MKPFAIAGVQMSLSATHENVSAMRSRLEVLMHLYPWVQMVLFSELAPFGPFTSNAMPFPNAAEESFQEMAERHNIWLLPGSMFERDGDKIYNTAPVISPEGRVVARYRKMFPFFPYEQGVEPGTEFCVFDVPDVGRFGVSICYDMWFPETTRSLATLGAEVILHPTLTSSIDRKVELSIAKASAACNQCFFFDINGAGEGGNGRSIVLDPAGNTLHEAGHADEIIPLEIDLERVQRSREVGLRGLGQPLKSFRDRLVDFEVYKRENSLYSEYLDTLGPLKKPEQGSKAGLREEKVVQQCEEDAKAPEARERFALPPEVLPEPHSPITTPGVSPQESGTRVPDKKMSQHS